MDYGAASARQNVERMLRDKSVEPTNLPLSLLQDITNNFADDQQIGFGGFAAVYKGLLQNGMVAVKKLYTTLDIDDEKFSKEVECLMKAHHKNVVRFLGYCADTQGRTIQHDGKFVMADLRNRLLCFEYVPNGSLERFITDASCGLEWRERYQIIKGICEGLHYLHDKHIVHLDLKPANILVGSNMVPKIADFGLSRCFDENQSRAVTSKLIGSMGYLAPESFNPKREITTKLDIYSFGVIILEMLTGGKGYFETENVIESWLNRLKTSSSDDTRLEQIRVCIEIGRECMLLDPAKRPATRHIIDRLHETASADCHDETVQQAENPSNELQQGTQKLTGEMGSEKFTAQQLFRASLEFLGNGTYGKMYKAILRDGSAVAVNKLRKDITMGGTEFEDGAAALGKIRHPNLLVVRAYYFDAAKGDKLLLFDFMHEGSLSELLHGKTPVDWATRMAIAKGTARGLAYLHDEMHIVHGKLTSSNVLVDNQSTPKIAEFGMSRVIMAAAYTADLLVPPGYCAPELYEIHRATAKTDVYNLGVIMLELLTRRPAVDMSNDIDLPLWVVSIPMEEWTSEVFDLELIWDAGAGGPKLDELMHTLKLALQCVDALPLLRPEAREVLRQLEEILPGQEGGAGPSDEVHVAPASN